MTKILVPILLILGLFAGVYLVSQRTNFFSRADISTAPQEIKVTNISDNSFTVSWTSFKATTGFVKYSNSEQLGDTASDDRDSGAQKPRLTHHVTLKNLEPGKEYFYTITSGAEGFDNKGQPFRQTTAPTTENPPVPPAAPVFGKVTRQDGSIPDEVLIYLDLSGGSPLSSYTREDGNWLITLNNARIKDLSNYITVTANDQVNLVVESGDGGKAAVRGQAGDNGSFSKVVLTEDSYKVRDLNRDGVINVFDYVLQLFHAGYLGL